MSLATVTRNLEDFRRDVSRTRRAVGSLTAIALCGPPLAAGFGTGNLPDGGPGWVLPVVAAVLLTATALAAVGEDQLRRTLMATSGVLALCDRMHGTGNDRTVARRLSERSVGRVNFEAPAGHLAALRARRRESAVMVVVGSAGLLLASGSVAGCAYGGSWWIAAGCAVCAVWRGLQVALGVRELRIVATLNRDILDHLGVPE